MPDTGYIAFFLIGLFGGVHCIGMCGGIVGALGATGRQSLPLHLAYNLGRISSYTAAGALVGALGTVGLILDNVLPVQMLLYVAANLMLIALGIYLTGQTRSLAFIERIGQHLWRHIQPVALRYLPARGAPLGPKQAYPLGLLWGWLPCGMVYSVLTVALLSGSAARGAATMLAFGLGTLPNLLLAGLLLQRLRRIVQARHLRLACGIAVMAFGVWGLVNATDLGGRLWAGIVCQT